MHHSNPIHCQRPHALVLAAALGLTGTAQAAEVSTVAELVSAINNATAGEEILIQDGTYDLNGNYLRITVPELTIRSASGNRDSVVLDGNRVTTEVFQVVASNTTIQDLTIQYVVNHPIHVVGSSTADTTGTVIDNVHIIDPGQQAIKINSDYSGHTADTGRISNCLIELTDSGRAYVLSHNGSCYTGGVDGHAATGWTVEDNVIQGFWCASSLSEHGIHFWSGSTDTLVQRNLIYDCDRGIGFGLGSSPHVRGIIRNNMIYHPQNHGVSDVGIGLENATGTQVYNNTVYLNHDYPNAIEYRYYTGTGITISNTLTNRAITSRDGAIASMESNLTSAEAAWFVDLANGDLHLATAVAGVVDSGSNVSGLTDDYDRGSRPYGDGIDIGADEYGATADPDDSDPGGNPITPGKAVAPANLLLLDQEH
jgi:hypothetical protein